jgi:hypothetical protein
MLGVVGWKRARPRAISVGMVGIAVATAVLASCAVPEIDLSPEAAAKVRQQELGSYPYHPLVYQLDLSIFSYQLYSQSLVWPFDPYYEDVGDRSGLMRRVRDWAKTTGAAQLATDPGVEAYRGPGLLAGFDDNTSHDPILYQYSRLHPWSSAVVNALASKWTEYLTPARITRQIKDVYVCSRKQGSAEADYLNGVPGTVEFHPLPARRADAAPDARDTLLVFEGGTGDKGEPGQPASQSLLGFALLRATGPSGTPAASSYVLHIAFRGSRSGSAQRAFLEAWSSKDARGNPDWITDLGYREVRELPISASAGHEVSRGISTSLISSFPTLFGCLEQVAGGRAVAPTQITITGHSLGGGLAQQLASAVLLGADYGPTGGRMPASLRAWPWAQLKLITFSAPNVGNEAWARALTVDKLRSTFVDAGWGNPFDQRATGITDPEIVPRLNATDRPVAYRVLIPTDPVTTDYIPGGEPVGHSVYLSQPMPWDPLAVDASAHEPVELRKRMLATLRDDRALPGGEPLVPPQAWAYRPMQELNPQRGGGSEADEYRKMADAVRAYYTTRDLYFDHPAFDAGVATFLELLGAN